MKTGLQLYLLLLFSLFAPLFALHQPDDPQDSEPIDPFVILESTDILPRAIASGANYFSFVPVHQSGGMLIIDNLARKANDILMVGEDSLGNRVRQVLRIEAEGTLRIHADKLMNFEQVYLISLQPFNVQSEKPTRILGQKTKIFTTVAPSRQLRNVAVDNAMGRTIILGLSDEDIAYYPAYPYKFGEYDPESRTVTKGDGTVYDVQQD